MSSPRYSLPIHQPLPSAKQPMMPLIPPLLSFSIGARALCSTPYQSRLIIISASCYHLIQARSVFRPSFGHSGQNYTTYCSHSSTLRSCYLHCEWCQWSRRWMQGSYGSVVRWRWALLRQDIIWIGRRRTVIVAIRYRGRSSWLGLVLILLRRSGCLRGHPHYPNFSSSITATPH